ncbi:hypothetical protein V865_007862 [Kwoniella europaea PYCC6329]|uniref:Uncharacterized protein n=1 Tax=Kwoniella europaea PYCC6329 TaxID=1423913 RepID=A0AAX4KUI9_9TREE
MSPASGNLLNPLSLSPTDPSSSSQSAGPSRMTTQSNKPPRFYLPSPSNSSPHTPVYPLSRVVSRAQSDTNAAAGSSASTSTSTSTSKDALYSRRSRSRASISNLRSALELYQIDHGVTSPDPSNFVGRSTDTDTTQGHPHGQSLQQKVFNNDDGSPSSLSPSSLIGNSKMDALVEIHRVLYRGKEDLQVKRIELTLGEEVDQVKRVVDRWFESDCVYDQPLVHLTSRESMLTHFALLHAFGTVYLPSMRPSALIIHLKEVISLLRISLLAIEEHVKSAEAEGKKKESDMTELPKSPGEEEHLLGLGLGMSEADDHPLTTRKSSPHPSRDHIALSDGSKTYDGWWKLWDVTADCKEIGEMDCYDGHYLAMIEHVIRLSLFPTYRNSTKTAPSTSHPSAYFHPKTPNPHFKHPPESIPAVPVSSFAQKIYICFYRDFVECWLDWDLRVNTMIQFNEVGKATHVRDVIDIRDLVESFVPFAKRLHLITTITGLITSLIGGILLTSLASNNQAVKVVQRGKIISVSEPIGGMKKCNNTNQDAVDEIVSKSEKDRGGTTPSGSEEKSPLNSTKSSSSAPMRIKSPIMDPQARLRKMSAPTPMTGTHNILGLEGVSLPISVKEGKSQSSAVTSVDEDST